MISECRECREMRYEERSELKHRASRGRPREGSQSLRTEFRFISCIFRSDSRALCGLEFACRTRNDVGLYISAGSVLTELFSGTRASGKLAH